MDTINTIGWGLCGAVLIGAFYCAGGISGFNYARRAFNPVSVYSRDVNDDKRTDIIIKSESGFQTVFLQQENGTYKPLYQILDEMQTATQTTNQEQIKQLQNTIDDKLKELK